MSSMPTQPDPRDAEPQGDRKSVEEVLAEGGYSPEEIAEAVQKRDDDESLQRAMSGEVTFDPEALEQVDPPGGSIGAMSPQEEAQFQAQAEEEDWRKTFSPFHRIANGDRTVGMDIMDSLTYGYSKSGSPTAGFIQNVADVPYVGDFAAGLIGGVERGSASTLNMILGTLRYGLEGLPNPAQGFQPELENFGMLGELTQGITQFATVAVPVAASTPVSTGAWLTMAVSSAVADATAFDPRNGNIATMAREFFPGSWADDYLSFADSKEMYELTGDQWYARALAAGEGFVVGEAAGLTLGGLVKGMGKYSRFASETAADANPAAGGVGGMLGDFGMPPEMAARAVDPSAFFAFNNLKALHVSRNSRATALKTANPEMTNAQMLSILEKEFADMPQALDLSRQAWADAMNEVFKGEPGNISRAEWRELATQIDPNRTFMTSEMLSDAGDRVLYQKAGAAGGHAGGAGAKGVDTRQMEGADRSARNKGPGNLGPTIKKQVAEFAKTHNLDDAQREHIQTKIQETLEDFPLSEWEEMRLKDIGWKDQKVGNVDGKNKPQVEFNWEDQPYTFGNEKPKGKSKGGLVTTSRSTPQYKARTKKLTKGLVEEVRQVYDNARSDDPAIAARAQTILNARNWYSTMRQRLGREWGGLRETFTELLGGLSPQTNVRDNFAAAAEVIQHYSRGTYDDWLKEYIPFRQNGGTFAEWEKMGKPIILKDGRIGMPDTKDMVRDGKRYGINSQRAADVLAGKWYSENFGTPEARAMLGGKAPKALNFTGNMMGESRAATIDVWAARLMQRLSGGKAIPAKSEIAVRGNFAAGKTVDKFGLDVQVGGAATHQFGLAQDVFARSLDDIRAIDPEMFGDMQADDLQALVWFLEKDHWSSRGWTNDQGAGGSFDFQADRLTGDSESLAAARLPQDRAAESDLGGRVVIGASSITDEGMQPVPGRVPPPIDPETGARTEGPAQATGGYEVRRVATPVNEDAALETLNEAFRGDNTAAAFTTGRNTGVFAGEGEDSFFAEITYGRVFGKEGEKVPKDKELLRQFDAGEITADAEGRFIDAEGNDLGLKSDQIKSRTVYPIEEEPTLNSALQAAAKVGADNGQDSVIVSRVLNDTEVTDGTARTLSMEEMLDKNPNARIGMEIRFDGPRSEEEIADMLKYLGDNYLGAQTIVDVQRGAARGAESKQAIVGIRVIDVPEFRLGEEGVEAIRNSADPKAAGRADITEQAVAYDDYINTLMDMDGVSGVDRVAVDTIVMGQQRHYAGQYGDFVDDTGSLRENAGEVWTGRSWYDQREAPTGSADEGRLGEAGDGGRQAGTEADPASDPNAPQPPPGDTELYQADIRDGGVDPVIRGSATVDDEEGIAFVRLFEAADDTTVRHEIGHVVRVQTLGRRAKKGGGALSPEDIDLVEKEYGVVDGAWTREQEEAFADNFMKWVESGGPRSSDVGRSASQKRAFAIAAASIKAVDMDSQGKVRMTEVTRNALDKINALRGLPEQYAPGRFVEVADFRQVINKIKEADAAGEDWRDVVKPEDILGTRRMGSTKNLRYDANTPEEAQKLIAHFGALTREMIADGVTMSPRTMEQMRQNALEELNALMGRDSVDLPQTMRDLLGSVDMTRTGKGAVDENMLTAQMLLHYKAKGLLQLAETARSTGRVVDKAMMHRAALEYQIVQAQIMSARSNWGRMGQAMQGVKLPTADELTNPIAAEQFLAKIGMPSGGLDGTSEEIMNALAHARMPEDAATIAKVIGDHNQQVGGAAKAFAWFQEYYVNNLLSGPKTWFGLSVISPIANMTFDGSARFVGGILSGKPSQSMQVLKNFQRTFQEASIAFEMMLRTFRSGQATMMPGVELYDGKTQVGAIGMTTKSDNGLVKALVGAVNLTGTTIRLPSRGIMTFDEFFRQTTARVALNEKFTNEVHDELLELAMETGKIAEDASPKEVRMWRRENKQLIADEVQKRVDNTIRDGRLRDQHAVMDEAMNKPEILAIEDDFERAGAVQQYFSDEFTQSHKRNVAYARDHGTRAVFQGDLGRAGEAISRTIDETLTFNGVAPLRILIPFFRTPWKIQEKFFGLMPTNTAVEGVSRIRNRIQNKTWEIPTEGNLGVLHRKHLQDLASGDPKRIAEARGRQAAGMMLVGFAWSKAEEGTMTGGGPADWQDRQAMIENGWQPYSIRSETGEKDEDGNPMYNYSSYMGMDPYAQYLALFADAYYLMNEEDGRGPEDIKYNFAEAMFIVGARQFHEKPYIQGISSFMEAFGAPERKMGKFLENLGRGFIPMSSMQQQLEYATDPYVVEARTILEGIRKKSWMFGDEDIEPRYNALGERQKTRTDRTPDWAHHWWNRVSPVRMSWESSDKLMHELERLDVPMVPPRTVNGSKLIGGIDIDLLTVPAPESMGLPEGWSVFAAWMERTGQVVENGKTLREALMEVYNKEDLQSVSDWEESELVDNPARESYRKIITAYQTAALAQVLEETPDLKAEIQRKKKRELEIMERNLRKSYGPDSPEARNASAGLNAVNKRLQEIMGADK